MKLYALRMTESTLVTEHVNNLNTLFSQLTSLSCKIEPQEHAENLLQSLHGSYDQLIIKLTSNILSDYLVFDDVTIVVLEEENRHNNKEDIQASSRQVEALMVTRGKSMEPRSNGSHNHEDGKAVCCEASAANETRKRFADVWLFYMGATFHMTARREWFHQYNPVSGGESVYNFNDYELKIIRIGSIMVKMHDGDVGCTQSRGSLICFRFSKFTKREFELDFGKKTKCLRTNNQGEYTELSGRANITLLERARAMLATTSLGKSFWAEAFNTACYVINCLPSTAVELKTLMEMYTDEVKGYRLWDPTAHKVVVNRDVVFMKDKIQENKEGDNTTRETTSIDMEKEFQSNDSFEVAPQHEMNETNKSQALATRTLNSERKRPRWHSDYVVESNFTYCLLTNEGRSSTLQEALDNPDASFRRRQCKKKSKLFIRTKHENLCHY
ncbi:gag-pol polyprotein [Tanacetum coccineum]